MRYIKKIDSIPLVDGGRVINSFDTTDNHNTNAPSIAAVEKRFSSNISTGYIYTTSRSDLEAKIVAIFNEMDDMTIRTYMFRSNYDDPILGNGEQGVILTRYNATHCQAAFISSNATAIYNKVEPEPWPTWKWRSYARTTEVDAVEARLTNLINNYWKTIYPVGSIYVTLNNTNPGTLFGGTWERWANGRVLAGYNNNDARFNSVGYYGGYYSQSYTPEGSVNGHALTVNEIPEHTHYVRESPLGATFGSGSESDFLMRVDGSSEYYTKGIHTSSGEVGQAHGHTFTGRAATLSTIQPYAVVYMWKRVA